MLSMLLLRYVYFYLQGARDLRLLRLQHLPVGPRLLWAQFAWANALLGTLDISLLHAQKKAGL
jgi:hypothetical protein